MVLYQSLHGAFHDSSQFHAEAFCRFFEFSGEGVGYRANEMYAKPWVAILLDVAYEEVNEAFDQSLGYLGDVLVFREEGGEAGQEAIGQRLAVHLF